MKSFTHLFELIDQTQSTNEKVLAIKNYFHQCSDEDGAWALFFLSGHRLKRFITGRLLFTWFAEKSQIPLWLIEECYASVGDTAECISLLLPRKEETTIENNSLAYWIEEIIKPLDALTADEQKVELFKLWGSLNTKEIFILNKILTGSFRVGVSYLLTLKALSQAIDVPRELLSQKLMGKWTPSADLFKQLKEPLSGEIHLNPYPFYLAYPIEMDKFENFHDLQEWLIEWKWDGIRAQAVLRGGNCSLWSRGNELISEQFPELLEALKTFDADLVLDGEIIAYKEDKPLPFAILQQRLGRKKVTPHMIKNIQVVFMVYDILEYKGEDLRSLTLKERRSILEKLDFTSPLLKKSTALESSEIKDLKELRESSKKYATEGLMLKKWDSVYGVGRQKGKWWKYKVDPMTLDAVLIYAQAGSGIRSNLFTDYTFAVWHENQLVPIAKAYSGLNQEEIKELDRWIRKNTEEKFGPVRKVKALQVFEIAFEAIQASKRHKSGVALRFPRILRWRKDKPPEECDSLETIKKTFLSEHDI